MSKRFDFSMIFFAAVTVIVLSSVSVLAQDTVSIDEDDAVLGLSEATVTIVAFLDLECPNSQKLYPRLRDLQTSYPESVRIVFKHFPLRIHPHAMTLAEVGQCAARQGKLFELADEVYANSFGCMDCLNDVLVKAGVDQKQHAECMAEEGTAKAVKDDIVQGMKMGVEATPTMFINGKKVEGAILYRQLFGLVKIYLKS